MFDLTPVGPGQTVDDALYERDRAALAAAKAVVQEQAEDDGLWFRAELITEEKLQIALRRLHAVIEGEGMMDERAVEVPCPACPDGNRWTREGPAGRCKVCNGTGILPARAVLHIPVGEE